MIDAAERPVREPLAIVRRFRCALILRLGATDVVLDKYGEAIWLRMCGRLTQRELAGTLVPEFYASTSLAEKAVSTLVRELAKIGLILPSTAAWRPIEVAAPERESGPVEQGGMGTSL